MTPSTAPVPAPVPPPAPAVPRHEATSLQAKVVTGRPPRSPQREPWVWLVVGIPALTVVAGLFTWWIAAQRADSDVADNHYKRGLAVNRLLEREQTAARAELEARIEVGSQQTIAVRLTAAEGSVRPEAIQLLFTHPVKAAMDHRVGLLIGADGVYRGQGIEAAHGYSGQWGLALEGPGWRLSGARIALHDGAVAQLGRSIAP